MKFSFFFTVIVWCISSNLEAQNQLKLKTMFQPEYPEPLELSGIAQDSAGQVFVVHDKTQMIYQLENQKFIKTKLAENFKMNIQDNDWEGIDYQDNQLFVLSEKTHCLIGNDKKITPDFAEYENRTGQKLYPEKWGNAGFEGACYGNQKLYFAKERSAGKLNDGRYILETDLTGKILRKLSVPKLEIDKNPDFAEIKYEKKGDDEFLYLLERNYYTISRLNLNTNEVVRYSYSAYSTDEKLYNNLYLDSHPEYGMAEALLFTEDEIWIGFDNNKNAINPENKYAVQYKLKGNQCLIMKFERGDF